jgi:hypothetical protein
MSGKATFESDLIGSVGRTEADRRPVRLLPSIVNDRDSGQDRSNAEPGRAALTIHKCTQ